MKTKLLGPGTDPDVAIFGGRVWCVRQEGAWLHLTCYDFELRELEPVVTWRVGEPNAYAKLCSWEGQLWVGWREGTAPYRIVLRIVGTAHQEYLDDRSDGPDAGHGSHPFVFGFGDVAWQASGDPGWDVWRRPLAGGTPEHVRTGVGTGLSRVLPEQVRTVDEDRDVFRGYTRPCWAGDLVVVEGPTGGTFCQLQDGRELLLWAGQDAQTPRCAVGEGWLASVTWGAPGVRLAAMQRSEFLPPGEATVLAPLGRPAFIGGFYVTTDKYPEAVSDYPQNVEVIVEASAIWRARTPVIASPDALSGVQDPRTVIGLYVAAEEEGTASALDLAAELARAAWRQNFPQHPVPAVVGYVTRGMAARATWPPRSVDVFAPECYFDLDELPTPAGVDRLVRGWEHVLSATRPWLIVAQEYDRNGAMWHLMGALSQTLPAYLDALRPRPWVLGLLAFAVNRPGGVRDYPSLLAAHRRIFAAVPGAPTALPVAEPPPINPGDDVLKVHIEDYARTGKVGEPAFIDFRIESDHPVTSIRVDWRRDGRDGLPIAGPDLRRLRGVKVEPEVPGRHSWHVRAENGVDAPDESQSERTIEVQE